jgi:hypothetical protein
MSHLASRFGRFALAAAAKSLHPAGFREQGQPRGVHRVQARRQIPVEQARPAEAPAEAPRAARERRGAAAERARAE